MKAKLLSCLLQKHPVFQPSLNTATMTSPNMLEVLGMNSQGLIHALQESFPPTNPTPDDTMQKIMYRSGQRSVVEWVIKYMEDN